VHPPRLSRLSRLHPSVPIASLKLRFFAHHVRVVPLADPRGCPFEGPGVDLFGDAASEAFALAAPLVGWLQAREPLTLRTLSIDLRKRRVLATAEVADARPRVISIDERTDAASVDALVALATPLLLRLGELAAARLEARRAHET
jgi:hypothetical protein